MTPPQQHPTPLDTSYIFRQRLQALMDRSGHNQAGFARLTGIDRSTLSQLLAADGPRLPRAETLVAVATACHVSIDWLMGLSQREEIGSEIIEAIVKVEPHVRTPLDERFVSWLREAEGYRVRTVPESFPDFMKTEAVIRFEYGGAFSGGGVASYDAVEARLAVLRRPENDLEVCASVQEITALALGQGKWHGLPLAMRQAQLRHLLDLYDELYPSVRIYLYSLTETYSNPFTIFGPKRIALFLGNSYLVLNSVDHIRLFSRRFDDLIRLAVFQPNQLPTLVRDLIDDIK